MAFTTKDPCTSQIELHQRSVAFHSPWYDMGSSSTVMTLPPWRPCQRTTAMPAQCQGLIQNSGTNYGHANPSYNFEGSNLSHIPEMINIDRPLHRIPQRMETQGPSSLRCHIWDMKDGLFPVIQTMLIKSSKVPCNQLMPKFGCK